jgi:hypothetical protein
VALAGGGAAVAWWMQPSAPPRSLPARPPDDDLALLVSLHDASEPRERPRDLLVAAGGQLVLARARDDTLVAFPAAGGPPRTVARLDGPAWGLVLAERTLWLSTTRTSEAGPRGAVVRVPLSGAPPRIVSEALAHPRAIASDGRWVFVVDVDESEAGLLRRSTIVRLAAEGGPPSVLARSDAEVAGVALDDANVYWADPLDGTIRTVPKAGGDARSLASERGLPEQLVVSGDTLVWVERRSESVWTMRTSGGAPRAVAQDFAGFANLVADRRGVWWTSEGAVDGRYRVLSAPLAGGDSRPAGDSAEPIDALATDGAHLYWARNGQVSGADAPASAEDRRQ